jgi:hypothetical protein
MDVWLFPVCALQLLAWALFSVLPFFFPPGMVDAYGECGVEVRRVGGWVMECSVLCVCVCVYVCVCVCVCREGCLSVPKMLHICYKARHLALARAIYI